MALHKGLVPIMFSFRAEPCWISLVNLGEDKDVADRENRMMSSTLYRLDRLSHWAPELVWRKLCDNTYNEEEGRKKEGQKDKARWHHQLSNHELSKFREMVKKSGWLAAVSRVTKTQTQVSDWTTTTEKGINEINCNKHEMSDLLMYF